MQSVQDLKKCDVCGKRRKRVVRMLWIETFDICRTCAIDRHGVTPKQWQKAWIHHRSNTAVSRERSESR